MEPTNSIERELMLCVVQARRMPSDYLEPCKDWTKIELNKAKKLYNKITQLQESSEISPKMFNEARGASDLLHSWIKRLEMNSVQTTCRPMNLLTDLGIANQSNTLY